MKHILLLLAGILSLSCMSSAVVAEDWPMWRYDVRRSGCSPQELPDQLELQWVRELPTPKTAWPNEPRLQFDASYLPVVLGKTLFVGSMIDGSLTAYDTETGKQRWTKFTNGPIRVAPVAWQGRVYVGSDDGYLYCFDAATGEENWKVRGASEDRQNYRHLGNEHLVSFWPVRGGPVIDDGILYFGAGIWPSMGVFILAVNADSGSILWNNAKSHYLDKIRIDHNELHEAGLSPQGHFLMTDGKLLVPNGRSMPAGLNPKTGKLLYYVQGYRNGDSRVTAADKLTFVGRTGIVNTSDGREVGNRWVSAGKKAPKGWDGKKRDLFEGPFYGYKFMPGCDYRSAIDDRYAYGVQNGICYAYDVNHAKTSLYDKKVGTQTIHPARWDAPLGWKLSTKISSKDQTTHAVIKAGSRLYSHVGPHLFAVDLPKKDEEPRLAWTKLLDGVPAELLVADGKLFVVFADGRISCFAAGKSSVTKYPLPRKKFTESDGSVAELAQQILDHTKVEDGYALVLGIDSGRLVEELLQRTNLHVIAVENDSKKVRSLRDRLVAAGLYGIRAEVVQGDPEHLPLPPYFANLLVSEDSTSDGPLSRIPSKKLFRLLRPYGGVACFLTPQNQQELITRFESAKLANAKVQQVGDLVSLQRVGALQGSFDWTHECADAARTFYSQDDLVKAPLAILWYGDGPNQGFFKYKDYGRGVKPQVAGGRLVAFDDRAQLLRAVDVYTGRYLWSRKFDTSLVRFATRSDFVYVVHDQQCDVIDAATGAVKNSFECRLKKHDNGTPGAVDIRVTDDLLLVAIGFNLPTGHSHPSIESGMWDAKILVALDRKNGKQLWSQQAEYRFNMHAIAAGGGMVFCTDSLAPLKADTLKRRGIAPKTFSSLTLAIDAKTGKTVWKKAIEHGYRTMTGRGPLAIRPYDDWLCYAAEHQLLLVGKLKEMVAIDAQTGKEVWSEPVGLQPLILRGDSFINQAGLKYDVRTGKRLGTAQLFRRGGCNYTVGNKNLLFLRNKCAAYVDLETQKEYSLRNLRSGCSNSLVAANGLLSVPCFSVGCICNYPLQTSFSMFHMPQSAQWSGEKPITLSLE